MNVPLNHDGTPQSQRGTTPEEFLAKLEASGVALPTGEPIITHCGSGGRGAHRRGSRVLPRASQLPSRCVGGKAAGILRDLGYDAYNGGSPANIAAARKGE